MLKIKKLSNFNILAITALFAICASSSHAQRWVSVKVNKKSEVIVAPGESTKTINFAFFSAKPTLSTLNIGLTAPKNTKLTAKSLGVSSSSSLESALKKIKSAYTIELAAYGGKMTKALTVGASTSTGNTGGGFRMICNEEASSQFLPQMRQAYYDKFKKYPSSLNELCDGIFGTSWRDKGTDDENNHGEGGNNGGGSEDSSTLPTLSATSHVLKDACSKAKYLVVLSVDLSKISSARRSEGFTLSLDLIENTFRGSRSATLKPKGEGRISGPILLAAMTSPANKHMYTRWASGSTRRLTRAVTKNMGKFYMNYGVSAAKSELKGGKMTVVVFDTNQAYGLCMRSAAVRQCLNGYKGGDC